MNIIAVVSGKGGTGKTFVAINLACGLTMLKKRCLLVDCSFGVRNVDVALGATTQSLFNIKDLIENTADKTDVIIKGDADYMPDLICASPGIIPNDFKQGFDEVFQSIFKDYDYVIFDTPFASGIEFDSVTGCCDTVVAVTTENYFSLQNTALCLARIDDAKNKHLIINRCSGSENLQEVLSLEDIADESGADILGIIREDEYADNSLFKADPIVRYDTYSGREFEKICNRIVGNYVYPDKKLRFLDRNKLVLKQKQ